MVFVIRQSVPEDRELLRQAIQNCRQGCYNASPGLNLILNYVEQCNGHMGYLDRGYGVTEEEYNGWLAAFERLS